MKRTRLSLSLLLACMLAGRLNNRYIAPLPCFQSSTTQAVCLIGDFFPSRNPNELQLYLSSMAADFSPTVGQTVVSSHSIPLVIQRSPLHQSEA